MDSYPKVCHFGEPMIAPIRDGNIIVEEKIDGSQFRIFCHKNERWYGSKSIVYGEDRPVDQMFGLAVGNADSVLSSLYFDKPTHIYTEFLHSNKHNTLAYERVPKNNLVVFDIKVDDVFLPYEEKKRLSEKYGFECVPLLWSGRGQEFNLDTINQLLQTDSMLGKEKVEGLVMKNYEQFHTQRYLLGQPMFAKYVREEFKERNKLEWRGQKSSKEFVQMLGEEYKAPARWLKAVHHLRDGGELTHSPKDIGNLIKEIQIDLAEEASEEIKQRLFDRFFKDINRVAISGFPEWYKEYLAKQMLGAESGEIKSANTSGQSA